MRNGANRPKMEYPLPLDHDYPQLAEAVWKRLAGPVQPFVRLNLS
jgi:hypothetical protein